MTTITRNEYLRNKVYQFMKEFTNQLYVEYDLTSKAHPTVFRNKRGATHKAWYNMVNGQRTTVRMHQIAYGYSCVDGYVDYGYTEYKSWQHLMKGRCPKGFEGAYYLAIHEFAHVLQTEAGKRFRGSVHNHYWAEFWKELEILFPFDEVKAKFINDTDLEMMERSL